MQKRRRLTHRSRLRGSSSRSRSSPRAAAATTTAAAVEGSEDVSGSVSLMGIWVAEGAGVDRGSPRRLPGAVPECRRDVQPRQATRSSTRSRHGGPGRQSARSGDNRAACDGAGVRRARRAPADRLRPRTPGPRRTTPRTLVSRAASTASCTGSFSRGVNKSTVWYNVPAAEDAGVEPPEDWEGFLSRTRRRTSRRECPPTRSAPSDGWTAHRPLREHLPPDSRAWRSTTSWPRTRSRGPTSPSRTPSPEWRRLSATLDNIAGGMPGRASDGHSRPPSRRSSPTHPQGRAGDRGRFRRGRDPRVDPKPEAETGFNVFTSRRSTARRPSVVGGATSS